MLIRAVVGQESSPFRRSQHLSRTLAANINQMTILLWKWCSHTLCNLDCPSVVAHLKNEARTGESPLRRFEHILEISYGQPMAKLPHHTRIRAWWLTHSPPLRLHVTILAPLLQNPPSHRFRRLLSSSINQPTCFTLFCKCDLASRAINPFSSRTYTSSLLIKQPEYSRHLYSELLAFPTVNLPLCLPQKISHRNWHRSPESLSRGVRMHRWRIGMMSIKSSSKNVRWPRPWTQPRRPPATVTPMTLNVSPVSKCLMLWI